MKLLILAIFPLLSSCTFHITAVEHEVGVGYAQERGGWWSDRDGAESRSGEWMIDTRIKTIWGKR